MYLSNLKRGEKTMPYDIELQFGYPTSKQAFEFADRIGKYFTFTFNGQRKSMMKMGEWEDFLKMPVNEQRAIRFSGSFEKPLKAASIETLAALEWKTFKLENDLNGVMIGVDSPWGARRARVWRMNVGFDPDEMGDTELTLGVNLSSRYYPSILDMQDESGTLGNCFSFNKENNRKIEICKEQIIKQIPEMHDAEVYIRQLFY
jgi:hypothetical protein